jgi:hypothetical protein
VTRHAVRERVIASDLDRRGDSPGVVEALFEADVEPVADGLGARRRKPTQIALGGTHGLRGQAEDYQQREKAERKAAGQNDAKVFDIHSDRLIGLEVSFWVTGVTSETTNASRSGSFDLWVT